MTDLEGSFVRRGPQAPLRCQWQGASDSDGWDSRTGISALPKGAGPVRLVEGGKWRPATRCADAGRLRGGARPGNKQCRVRRGIQPTHSERALLIEPRNAWRSFDPNDIRLERTGYLAQLVARLSQPHWCGSSADDLFARA